MISSFAFSDLRSKFIWSESFCFIKDYYGKIQIIGWFRGLGFVIFLKYRCTPVGICPMLDSIYKTTYTYMHIYN